jgi:putative phage-type endonuclease
MATANLFLEQRSDEWRMARCGKVTASEISNVLSKPAKGKQETAGRANYRAQIIAEILTKKPQDDPYISRPMQWGIDQEPFARAAYELERGFMVDTVGFCDHPRIENFGCSPDGLVSDEGLVQFKCPNTATHIEYLLKGEVPAEYQAQMFAEMACTGRLWCDFVSFDPRLPEDLQFFVKRLHWDEARIVEIEQKVVEFLGEVRDVLNRLACMRDLVPVLKASVELAMVRNAKRGPQPVVAIMDSPDEVAGLS